MPNYRRYKSSITNNTRVFSIMNGLAPHSYSGRGNSRATKKLVIPADPEEGLEYMKKHDLLSKNPACSGGVGRVNHTYCTSKDGLFMSAASNNSLYNQLYNHIYKSDDITTHHLICISMYDNKPGVTVGKITDQGFDSKGNPQVTENMFMCDISSNLLDACTTDVSNVFAFKVYTKHKKIYYDYITNPCLPKNWNKNIMDCSNNYGNVSCSQQTPKPNTIIVDDASGFIGILAIVSIGENFKPITFKQIDLSGEWVIPEISMNIYYPTRSSGKNQPYFNILPGAKITNNAHITFKESRLNTILFNIKGEFTNNGTIKYESTTPLNVQLPDRKITFFNVESDNATFTNNGVIELPGISDTSANITFVNVNNGAQLINSGDISINSIDNSGTGFHITNKSTFTNTNGNISIGNIENSMGLSLIESSFVNTGNITMANISEGKGFVINTSSLNHDVSGTITIGDIVNGTGLEFANSTDVIIYGEIVISSLNGSDGFNLNKTLFYNNSINITIGDIDKESNGVLESASSFVNTGNITMANISEGKGFVIIDSSLNHDTGTIKIGDIVNGTGLEFANSTDVIIYGEIVMGRINGGKGFVINTSSLNHDNGTIKIGDIVNGTGLEFANPTDVIIYGEIVISSLNGSYGFNLNKTLFYNNSINITIGDIDKKSNGVLASDSSFVNTGNITIGEISSSDGFQFNNSVLSHEKGTITLGNISNQSIGVDASDSSFVINSDISLGNISSSDGFQFNKSVLSHENGTITIGEISSSDGFQFNTSVLSHENGTITLGKITNGKGFNINKNSSFVNTKYNSGSKIIIGNISNLGNGVLASDSSFVINSDITVGDISNSDGFQFNKSVLSHENGTIKIGDIDTDTGFGLHFTYSSDVVIKGGISINNIKSGIGFLLDNSDLSFSNSSIISIINIDNNGNGFKLTHSGLTTSDFIIDISNINSSYGFNLENSTLTNNDDTTITIDKITNGTGFHITNKSTLTNSADINLTTVEGHTDNIAYGLYRDATSSIVNNKSILFTDIKNKAVGVVADIPSILPHEIMGGYGKIDVSNIDYNDITNPYTYAFGKRGIALTKALMDSIKKEDDYYCPITHPYAYVELDNFSVKFSGNEVYTDGGDPGGATVKPKCCSVKPTVSGISDTWTGWDSINNYNKLTGGTGTGNTTYANISAPRELVQGSECENVSESVACDQCNKPAGRGWTGAPEGDSNGGNGGWITKITCPSTYGLISGSVDLDGSNNAHRWGKTIPGTHQTDIMTTRMTTWRDGASKGCGVFSDYCANQRVYGFGYGWQDVSYAIGWDNSNTDCDDTKINNDNVYCLKDIGGEQSSAINKPTNRFNKVEDTIQEGDRLCADRCRDDPSCSSYSLMPISSDTNNTKWWWCLGRNDGYIDIGPIQSKGDGGAGSGGTDNPGTLLHDGWSAKLSQRSQDAQRLWRYNDLCTKTSAISFNLNTWPTKFNASTVGFITAPPQIAPFVTMSGAVKTDPLKNDSSGHEQWCHFTKDKNGELPLTDKITEEACYKQNKCWKGDLNYGGCYDPKTRNDGGVLSLENLPSVGADNANGCKTTSTSTYVYNSVLEKPLLRGLEVYFDNIPLNTPYTPSASTPAPTPSDDSNTNRDVANMKCSQVG